MRIRKEEKNKNILILRDDERKILIYLIINLFNVKKNKLYLVIYLYDLDLVNDHVFILDEKNSKGIVLVNFKVFLSVFINREKDKKEGFRKNVDVKLQVKEVIYFIIQNLLIFIHEV